MKLQLRYISVTLFSLLTFRRIKRVEKLKQRIKELKEQLERENNFNKL